jgi:WD40 repeat protein
MTLLDNTLVSISADATIRTWNPFSIDELNEADSASLSCLNENKEEGTPTSVDYVNSDKSRIVVSFDSNRHCIYDIETSKLVTKFDYSEPKTGTLHS